VRFAGQSAVCEQDISPLWRPVSLVFAQTGERNQHFAERKRSCHDTTTIIQIVALCWLSSESLF
jgi:hypothetical protein